MTARKAGTPVIKIYIKRSDVEPESCGIENENGTPITVLSQTVAAAQRGCLTDGLLSAMRQHGLRPAIGETVYLIDGDQTLALS